MVRGNGRPRRPWVALAIAATMGMVCASAAHSETGGALDRGFSNDGRASFPAADSFVARAVAIDSADRIVVAGYRCEPDPISRDGTCLADGNSSFRVARLTRDGGLDSEFGDNGIITTPMGDGRSQALDLMLMGDGDIVVAGVAVSGGHDVFALARYTARGFLDQGFGVGGRVLQTLGTSYSSVTDIAPGPGGYILAAGQAVDAAGIPRSAVARFSPAGELDRSFGSGGLTMGGALGYGYALGMTVSRKGIITTAGVSGADVSPTTYQFGELRLNPTGTPLTSFGENGAALQRVGNAESFATAVVGAPGNGFVAAGAAVLPDDRQTMAVVRGTPAGGLDPTFGAAGTVLIPQLAGSAANDVLAYPDGRILVIGQAASAEKRYSFSSARLLPNGKRDPEWGTKGVRRVSFPEYGSVRATASALQSSGRLVTAGIGCAGALDIQCKGGTAVLVVTRQLGRPSDTLRDSTPPRITLNRLPARISHKRLRRKGVRLKVGLSEPARLRVVARRRGKQIARKVNAKPANKFDTWLKARASSGKVRLAIRAVDASGNATTRKFTFTVA